MNTIERQVFTCFDGPGGLVIQTDIATYNSYYKRLGWELMGRAAPLPGILDQAEPGENIGIQKALL